MKISEQVRDLENTRAARVSRMEEVASKAMEEGRSLDEAEQEEFDGLSAEVKGLDADLNRMRELETLMGYKAEPVPTKKATDPPHGEPHRGPKIIVNREAEDKFEGQSFTRKVIAKALAQASGDSAIHIAEKRWSKTNPKLVEVIRAQVAGGGTGSGEWGAELADSDTKYTGDFIEYLWQQTLYDQLPLREVPARVHIKGQDGVGTGYWVGESKPIPASANDFNDVELTPLKVAALSVVSNELLADSSPSAEMLVRDALIGAIAQRTDTTFMSSDAAVSGVSPAGILVGANTASSSGPDVEGLYEDIQNLYAYFLAVYNAKGLVYAMNPSTAKAIQLMRSSLGQKQFPDINADGGMLEGDRVFTSDNVSSSNLVLLKPSDIYRIGDMGIEVSMSRDAFIEQHTAPTGATDTPVAQTQYGTSMFQAESTAIKLVRRINFAKRRSSAVAYLSGVAYAQGTSGA